MFVTGMTIYINAIGCHTLVQIYHINKHFSVQKALAIISPGKIAG
jgi:hypothetical protein